MNKNILVEINRSREMMGLERLLTEEEKQNQSDDMFSELIASFKTTPKDERNDLKIMILKGLKESGADGKTIKVANDKMDEFMDVEEVEIKTDSGDDEDGIEGTDDDSLNEQQSSKTAYSRSGLHYKVNRRRGKCSDNWSVANKAACLLKKLIRFGTGWEIWDSGRGPDWYITTRKSRSGEESSLSSMEEYSTDKPREEWDKFYDKWNKKMLRKITNKRGKGIWEAHWEAEDGKYKEFMITVLEEFIRMKKKRGKIHVTISDKPHETIKKGDKIIYPVVPFQFPIDEEPDAQYFVDNCYEVTPNFVQQVNLLIEEIVKAGEGFQPKEGKPKFWLKFLEIVSSCSAVPNGKTCGETVLPKPMTFPELAEARGNAAKDYVMEKLKEINCAFGQYDPGKETEISINAKGENGDGTSGPAWNTAYGKYIKPWKASGQKTIVSDDNAEELKKNKVNITEINSIFEQYEKSKKCAMGIEIIVNTQVEGKDEYEPDEIIATDRMIVTMNVPGRSRKGFGIRWTWPALRWRPLSGLKRLIKGATHCLGFG